MKKNIIFYYHNFGGLGHGNRISLIIQDIINNFLGEYNIIVLNSGEKQDFLFSEHKNLKIINLPNYEIIGYKIKENIFNNKIKLSRKNIFSKLLSILDVESLVVEHFPFGRNFLYDELKNFISEFKRYNYKGSVFSSVRDIFDIDSLNYENLKLFDRFLVHGDERIINYENKFDKKINRKIIYTGYVVNKYYGNKESSEKNHILVSIGGGQDGLNFVADFLDKLNKTSFYGKVYVNLGKNYNDENVDYLKSISKFELEVRSYFDDFLELKKHAKIVVSMGGYNNFIENVFYKKKIIIYPRKSDKEQQIRLDMFSNKLDFIFDGNKLDYINIDEILSLKVQVNNYFDFNGACFSSSFIVNFKKYKFIKIRLTNACNAKCDMCGVIKRKREYNDMVNIKKSILDFYKLGGEVVNFTGGEPTIYKGFFELLKFSKDLGLITSVSTNGSTLSEGFYDKIMYNGTSLIDFMDVSIDGLYGLHDKIRQYSGLFSIIEKNIVKVKELGIFLHMNITIRKDNISQMANIFNFFKERKVASISFSMISTSPINDTSHLFPNREELKKFYDIDKKHILDAKGNIKVTFSPDYISGDFDNFVNFIINNNSFEKKVGDNCNFIKSKKEIRVNENGNISPCCIIDDYDEKIGNINENGLLKIICSKNYEAFLDKKIPNISKACLNCKIEI